MTKAKAKHLLPSLGVVNVCDTVKRELVKDEHKYPDAAVLRKNIENRVINVRAKVRPITSRQGASLGTGELETIDYCLKKGAILVSDDRQAINYALGLGLKPKTSEIILLDLLDLEIIDDAEFTERFGDLSSIKQMKAPVITYFKKRAMDILDKKKATKEGTR
ncbi:MAG: hypothetical protein JW839_14755 [Candidatus Lokiarchaeota archaeon]|nr:hypothetical protein [Candidatus Lokiarchaeota archaeon]